MGSAAVSSTPCWPLRILLLSTFKPVHSSESSVCCFTVRRELDLQLPCSTSVGYSTDGTTQSVSLGTRAILDQQIVLYTICTAFDIKCVYVQMNVLTRLGCPYVPNVFSVVFILI